MKQWWNNATIRNFRERAQCIIDQYSKYRIDEVGMFMNGRMTQGENIAVSFKLALGNAKYIMKYIGVCCSCEAFKVLSKALKNFPRHCLNFHINYQQNISLFLIVCVDSNRIMEA